MRKRIAIALLLFALLVAGFPASAFAEAEVQSSGEAIAPFWTNIASMRANLSIANGRATMSGMIVGHAGTERIHVTAVLERIYPNGTRTLVLSTSSAANGSLWAWERSHPVTRGNFYRLMLTATVLRNGFSEVDSISTMEWSS